MPDDTERQMKVAAPTQRGGPNEAAGGDSPRDPIDITYTINVNEQGEFSYSQPTDWIYRRGDRITYKSESGPFSITFVPNKSSPKKVPASPWKSKKTILQSSTAKPFQTAEELVRFPKPPAKKNMPPVTYDYHITVMRKNSEGETEPFTNYGDNSKNGSVAC